MIKKIFLIVMLALAGLPAFSQSCYWVFLTDKQGTTFDPYAYFDAKAIERYRQCGADLYDISNYPLNGSYVSQIDALAIEEVGQSRWLNAVAVMALPDQIEAIRELSFVKNVVLIATDIQMASARAEAAEKLRNSSVQDSLWLYPQLQRMEGQLFAKRGIDGHGIRIAVLDAGFPRVNTHAAFQHLRDNHQILDTWNFPTRKADVYGWNKHGLMTLSCITGRIGNTQLGLATGAEFLLYRTEVELEPFKEEVWWMQGMERADQHGANIISSSLGYGKERYYTKDMDGTSYVAKAANLAAKKGILVCNSAGNEADVRQWRTIITPADADSVLCVGGITPSMTEYERISFSSIGPSADGRMKPNVVAFGHATVASEVDDNASTDADGTSFSCPLVSGFVACAWQTMPGKTAMQMMEEIQKSADRYPYYDYSLGYGVPQAAYFIGLMDKTPRHIAPTFVMKETKDSVEVHLLKPDSAEHYTIFFNKQRPDGTLEQYKSISGDFGTYEVFLCFPKGCLDTCTLNVSYNGYTDHFTLNAADRTRFWGRDDYFFPGGHYDYNYKKNDIALLNETSNFGSCAKYRGDLFFAYGDMIRTSATNTNVNWYSPTFHFGGRLMRAFGKAYCLGIGLEYVGTHYNLPKDQANALDNLYQVVTSGVAKKQYYYKEFNVELFQRIRLVAGGILGKGLYWDLGVYMGWDNAYYNIRYDSYPYSDDVRMSFKVPTDHIDDGYRVFVPNWGVTTRVGYDCLALYARYRMSRWMVYGETSRFLSNLPCLEVGLQLVF